MSFKVKGLVLAVLLTILSFISLSSVAAQVTVNTVEDPKAMGYPDDRKDRSREKSAGHERLGQIRRHGGRFQHLGSFRWSFNRINGGTVDVVYSSGSAAPYSVLYKSLGSWQ